MKLALREMRRRPGRFVVAWTILALIAVLLMFLGGLLDGLLGSQTGAYRSQQADLIVYSENARESLPRSQITPEVKAEVERVEGVAEVGSLGSTQLGARPEDDPDSRDLMAVVLFGYEVAPRGVPEDPPGLGKVVADSSLRSDGVSVGDTLLIGPARTPVEVVGMVDATTYSGQASLWASIETWRAVTDENRPDLAGRTTVQALMVRVEAGDDPEKVAAAIDDATGETKTLTISAAIEALPGVSQQRSTFSQIIGVTALVAGVVVALFFALITVERTALYGILKAIGASNRTLVGGVVLQALVVSLAAALVGAVAALVFDVLIEPGALPFAATPARLLTSTMLLVIAGVVGSAFSLRRVLRVDPAAAIGGTP